jgi:putative ABC transport system ATP-binding protein
MTAIIRTDNVKKLYRVSGEEVLALKGISLEIQRGEFISIMGPSGSGKSTFFNQVGALDMPTEGKVYFDGQSIFDLSEGEQAWVRCNKIGYVFQTYNLIDALSALQNVTLPMIFQGATEEESARRGTAILDRVGLGHRLHHRPFELSGGQQQRVAIARALANTPAVILADEPTGNLDTKTGTEIVELLRELNKKEGVTVICATHDHKMLASSDRVCYIRDGKLHKISTSAEIDMEALKR